MEYTKLFTMPKPVTIKGRSSSITNAFINGIIPCIQPTEDDLKRALSLLGMNKDTICCSYCGDNYTEWDHLNPLIINKQPTGYISEIENLVPACGKCNQSKGNRKWKEWIIGSAKLSPKTRGVKDIELRIKRLEAYEANMLPHRIDFAKVVGIELWAQHQQNYQELIAQMESSQVLSNKIRDILKNSIKDMPDNHGII